MPAWFGMKLFWKALPWLLLAAAIAGSVIWIKLLRADNALLELQKKQLIEDVAEAVEANRASQAAIVELQLARIKDREATLKEQERRATLHKNLEAAKKEMRNAPNANAPAGDYFDGIADSLRGVRTIRGHEADN